MKITVRPPAIGVLYMISESPGDGSPGTHYTKPLSSNTCSCVRLVKWSKAGIVDGLNTCTTT